MPSRKSLIERLKTFIRPAADSQPTSGVFIISSDKGSGKSYAIKEFIDICFSGPEDHRLLYYEFRGGNLCKDQTANDCLMNICSRLSIYLSRNSKNLVSLNGETTSVTSRKTKQNPYFLDCHTLFQKYIMDVLKNVEVVENEISHLKPLVIIIDGPERCDPGTRSALLDVLCNKWPECVYRKSHQLIKLIISTSFAPNKLFSNPQLLEKQREDIEILTRLSSKGKDNDECIREMFVQGIASKHIGEDPEWESVKIDSLTKLCNGSVFVAKYILAKDLLDRSPSSIPTSCEEICKQEYRPWFGPFLCARMPPPLPFSSPDRLLLDANVPEEEINLCKLVLELFVNNNACLDWYFETDKERWRKEGHGKACSLLLKQTYNHPYAISHALFHAMESGEPDAGRICLVDFTNLYYFAQTDLELLFLDSERYCIKRPHDMSSRIIKNCLQQSKRALMKDSRELPFQFLARIQGVASDVRGDVEISNLLNSCRNFKSSEFTWFRPIRASMALVPETTLRVIRGHADTILSVSCTLLDSPQPKLALTGSCDGTAKLFDIQTGQCLLTLSDHGNGYCSGVSLACLDDELLLALTCTQDGNARLWYTRKLHGYFQCFTTIDNENNTTSTAWKGSVPAHTVIGHEKELTGCCFMPKTPKFAATCSADHTAKLWELPLPGEALVPLCKKTFVGHKQPVLCVAFIPENYSMIATGSGDKTIRIWSTTAGNDSTGVCLSVFSGHFANITCIAFRSDGVVFATGGWDSIAKVWNISEALNQEIADPALFTPSNEPTVKEECMLVHKDWIWGVTFVENDRDLLATGADNGIVRLWSLKSQACILAFDAHLGIGVYCLASVGSDFLVSGGLDSVLRVFDISKERCTGRNTTAESWTSVDAAHRHQNRVRCAAFPAQTLKRRLCVLGSDDKTIRAFDLNTGRCVKTLPQNERIVRILVSSDENSLKSFDVNKKWVKWNRATFEPKPKKTFDKFFDGMCCMNSSGWMETAVEVESELAEGRFLPPKSLNELLLLSEEEDTKPFIPLTFDTMDELQCWCSPAPMTFSRNVEGQQTEDPESLDAVVVVTEKNGLVHILHPMI